MAHLHSIFSFSGKLGDVVGYRMNGKNYIRKAPVCKKREPSKKQLEQQAKFMFVGRFVHSMNSLLNKTCQDSYKKMSGANHVFSYTFHNLVKGMYPNYVLDYSQARISKGSLQNAVNPSVNSSIPGFIHFSWLSNCHSEMAHANDKAILVAYCEETGITKYKLDAAARCVGWAVLDARIFSGKKVHTWLAFTSENGKKRTNSMYTGIVDVMQG